MIDSKVVYSDAGCDAVRLATDDHYNLSYGALVAAAEPANWPKYMPQFTNMIANGTNGAGWSRYIEHVRYGLIRIRTPLKFWKETTASGGYRIDYALDTDPVQRRRVDHYITADEGFIWVEPEPTGVHVRTVKVLGMSGMHPTIAAIMAPWLGWSRYSAQFFQGQAQVKNPAPFVLSTRLTPS